jgi:hypothetical protein
MRLQKVKPLRVGRSDVCRNCGRPIETKDFDWAGGIQWCHVGGFVDCARRNTAMPTPKDWHPDWPKLEKDRPALLAYADELAEGHMVSGMKGNALDMAVANCIAALLAIVEERSDIRQGSTK